MEHKSQLRKPDQDKVLPNHSPKQKEDIKDFAETTMNEMLGWYGYEKISSGDTDKLDLHKFERGSDSESEDEEHRLHRQTPDDLHSPDPKQHSTDGEGGEGMSDLATQHQNLVSALTNGTTAKSRTDGNQYGLCSWCQKFALTLFNLKTPTGTKIFCSETCFTQCRRSTFKKNKICDWCKHVRHTVDYVDFQDGETTLQFCSEKCLNQYKMNIFCYEAQEHLLQMQSKLNKDKEKSAVTPSKSKSANKEVLITPDLWDRSKMDSSESHDKIIDNREDGKEVDNYLERGHHEERKSSRRAKIWDVPQHVSRPDTASTPGSGLESPASSVSPTDRSQASSTCTTPRLYSRDTNSSSHGTLLKEALTTSKSPRLTLTPGGYHPFSAMPKSAPAEGGSSSPPMIQIPASHLPPMMLPPGFPPLPFPPYPYPPYPYPAGIPGVTPHATLMVPFPIPVPVPIPIPMPFPVKDGKMVLLPEFSSPERSSPGSSHGEPGDKTRAPSSDIEVVRTNYLNKELNSSRRDEFSHHRDSPSSCYSDRVCGPEDSEQDNRCTPRPTHRSPGSERHRPRHSFSPSLSPRNSMKLITEPCGTPPSRNISYFAENEAIDLSADHRKRSSPPERPLSTSSSVSIEKLSPRMGALSDSKMIPHGLVLPIIAPSAPPMSHEVKADRSLSEQLLKAPPALDSKYSARRERILDAPQVPAGKKRSRSPSPDRHYYRHEYRNVPYPKRKCFRPKINKTKLLIK